MCWTTLKMCIPRSIRISGWRSSITGFSTWFFKSTDISVNVQENENDQPCTSTENKVPKLPVPDLHHTLSRYLETLEPILTEKQFERTRKIVENFGSENGVGTQLQKILLKRRETHDNWAYEWWLNDMYLNNQVALPINSNPGMVFPLRVSSGVFDPAGMAQYAARIITAALTYNDKLDRNELPTETINCNGKSQPMCMKQYYRIFTSYRIPGIVKDTLIKSETEYTKTRPHIVVACNEQFYVVHLTKGHNAEPLSENELIAQLFSILKENQDRKGNKLPVGILTGLKRDSWATIREQLITDEENKKNLSIIEKCMFIICFDLNTLKPTFNSKYNRKQSIDQVSTRDETSMAHQMIHGGGSSANSGNRWFEKTIQIIIGSDGVNGLCYEHSPAEGVAVINTLEMILANCENFEDLNEIMPSTVPEKLSWNVTRDIEKQIYATQDRFDKLLQDLDFNVFRFKNYGKNFIKSCRVSPDAYVQVALQFTYYKLSGKLCATYESASTRRFSLGRVDCIRANTMEVLKWVTAMRTSEAETRSNYSQSTKFRGYNEISMETKLKLLDKAIWKQTEITKENISGHGIDVHLLGLRQATKDLMINVDLFDDEAYSIANHFSLSTSQVATKIDGFMGYGPVVPDGYGASYNPKGDSIIFCISSFHSDKTTSTSRFTEQLEESLNSMKDLFMYKN